MSALVIAQWTDAKKLLAGLLEIDSSSGQVNFERGLLADSLFFIVQGRGHNTEYLLRVNILEKGKRDSRRRHGLVFHDLAVSHRGRKVSFKGGCHGSWKGRIVPDGRNRGQE